MRERNKEQKSEKKCGKRIKNERKELKRRKKKKCDKGIKMEKREQIE